MEGNRALERLGHPKVLLELLEFYCT